MLAVCVYDIGAQNSMRSYEKILECAKETLFLVLICDVYG